MNKICIGCGSQFTTKDKRQKYCSLRCAYDHRPSHKVTVLCDYCGAKLHIFYSRAKTIKHHFCNHDCQNNWQKLFQSGTNNAQWRGTRLARVCKYCKRTFKPPNKSSKFCSNVCRMNYLIEIQTKEFHPSWKGGITKERRRLENTLPYKAWRQKVFKRDKYRCAFCGSTRNIQAHHIKPFADYSELRMSMENGITLCKECHLKTYRKEALFEQKCRNILDIIKTLPELSIRVVIDG